MRRCRCRNHEGTILRVSYLRVFAVSVATVSVIAAAPRDAFTLDRPATQWVQQTLAKLTLDEKISQLIVPSFDSNYLSTDIDPLDPLARLVGRYPVGGFPVFGPSVPAPQVLLIAGYGTVILGQPFPAAFLINRLLSMSTVPLLNTADFETGVGFRISGATSFPRQMAMGAIAGSDGERLVREEARITALEARGVGVGGEFAAVADGDKKPRNPVVQNRSDS